MDADKIGRRVAELRARLEELRASVPAHASSIHHMVEIEDIEEELERLERLLK